MPGLNVLGITDWVPMEDIRYIMEVRPWDACTYRGAVRLCRPRHRFLWTA